MNNNATGLRRVVHERLVSAGLLNTDTGTLVLAALDGQAAIEAALRAEDVAGDAPPADAQPEKHGVYLTGLAVEGFRGIGPRQVLTFTPSPSLTLIVGRNGAGKSSFAEALELLVTGTNRRWQGRSGIWSGGWRNLHNQGAPSITASIAMDGESGGTQATLTATWPDVSDLNSMQRSAQLRGEPRQAIAALGWSGALDAWRPFLSYNELGSLFDDGPSKLYDALSTMLGLEALVTAGKALSECRKTRQSAATAVDRNRKDLVAALDVLIADGPDARATTCRDELTKARWDLDAVDAVLASSTNTAGDDTAALSRVAAILRPDAERVNAAVDALLRADEAVRAVAGTDAEVSRRRADLLDAALKFHDCAQGPDCPVCGRVDGLGEGWVDSTRTEVARLRMEALKSDQAHAALRTAMREARGLLTDPPEALSQVTDAQLPGVDAVCVLWRAWAGGRSLEAALELAAHLADGLPSLAAAAADLSDRAATEVRRREDRWRPLAGRLSAWIDQARLIREVESDLAALKAAEDWLKDATDAIRTERFAPIADRTMAAWEHLRQQSSVDLKRVALVGAATQRRVTLDVTIDNQDGAALGVMSQGELHALALSLFLPRATLDESPFRFVVIDDPVQSMDPARVDGLARVLEDTARTRQVIVFTHDNRLPEAVRRLRIPAIIHEVMRRGQSAVEVREALTPVQAYLDDARALVRTTDLPDAVRRRIIPGFCRLAIEAALTSRITRRAAAQGQSPAAAAEAVAGCTTTMMLAALALFDDRARGGDVLARLNQWGRWAGDAFQACRTGAHGAVADDVDLEQLVRNAEGLVNRLEHAS
jgi:recombinational DNA repair ATPase RecF